MKKIISIITIFALLTLIIFAGNSFAVSLDTLNVQTDKTTVRPGENVKVTIEFGQSLGAYTFDIAYDNHIFEYVSVEGGTANNTQNKVRVIFHDSTGGTNPRTNMNIIFKAKSDLTTSNPTEFTITGEGLANADASITYDDITTPIIKNVTVEPEYVAYTLKLEHTGSILKEQEKEMTLFYSSPMGRYYEHARLVAQATTPEGANVKLLGTDESGVEHDIIQSGWGDAQGYKIGGKDVSQVLNVKGVFSELGNCTITLKLIDRDNSDQVITEKTFNFTVIEKEPPVTEPETPGTTTPEENQPEVEEVKKEETPTQLPKTGNNIYAFVIAIMIILISFYVYHQKRK